MLYFSKLAVLPSQNPVVAHDNAERIVAVDSDTDGRHGAVTQ